MDIKTSQYSPNILIYLEVGEKRVRLADVLHDTATLYEPADFPSNTRASLVFSIDGEEEREEVLLHEGVSSKNRLISFLYANPEMENIAEAFPFERPPDIPQL